jgi:hypothetical protein
VTLILNVNKCLQSYAVNVAVTGTDYNWVVHRRYTDFLRLHRAVCEALRTHPVDLNKLHTMRRRFTAI